MKKNYLRIIFVTLAILMLSIGIALLSVTALNGDEIAVTSGEYGDILIPVSSEGGLIEDELPSMGEITVGGNFGEPTVMTPNATTTEVLPEGVYALKNVGNTNRWMDMEQNHVKPGKHIQQYAYANSPATTFSRAGLFKISKKSGTTNQYIIRSMLNNRLSFGFTNDYEEVVTVKIDADDDDVDIEKTFTITYDSGYIIEPYESGYAISAPDSTASGSDSYLEGQSISSINNRARWNLQKYEGENYSGGYITADKESIKGLTVGTPYTLTTYGWTTLIGVNKIKLSVPSAYSDIISGTWNTSSESLPLTIKKAGPFKINQYMYDTTGSSETLVRSFYGNYMAVPPIEDGVNYYLQNMGTKRYMDVEGPSTAEGAIIQQWNYSTALQKKWIFTRESGGYFYIKSAYSNKYVGVDSTNTSVIRQYGAKSDYTLWYFEETTSGHYALYCKATVGTGSALATPSATSGNGVNLTTAPYTDNAVYRDEWNFYSNVYTIRHYYDASFASKQQYIDVITEATDFLNLVYNKNFHINFNADTQSPSQISINTTCSRCIDNCQIQHHNLNTIYSQMDSISRSDNSIYVLWMDHNKESYCSENSGSCEPYFALGVAKRGKPIIQVLSINDYIKNDEGTAVADYIKTSSVILAHEMTHCFNFEDVYNDKTNMHPTQSSIPVFNCIMGAYCKEALNNFYDDIINGNKAPFCETCKIAIQQKIIENNFFEGN